jgi:HlyD family secretion protein
VKKWIIIVAVVLVVAGGGLGYYFCVYSPTAKADAPKIDTAKVERGSIRLTVVSTGKVVSNLDVDIKCKASGEIIKLPFDISNMVKKGDLLLELDPIDQERILHQQEVSLAASQARLASAKENLALAERTLTTDTARAEAALKASEASAKDAKSKAERMKQLFEKQLASQEDCDTAQTAASQAESNLEAARVKMKELESQKLALEIQRQNVKLAEAQVEADTISRDIAKDRLDDTKVVSPMDAIVAARNVQIGVIIASGVSNVGGGTTVMTLSDLSRMFVLASVDESDIGKVKLDQPVTITADAFSGKTFKGKVVRIAPQGVNVSNVVTFEVKIEVTSENKTLLKPAMTANVEILAAAKEDVLQVPTEAIVRKGGGKQIVSVVKDDGSKEEVPVVTGISDGTKIEVSEGLAEGQMVVVNKSGADSRFSSNNRNKGGPPMGMPPMGGKR